MKLPFELPRTINITEEHIRIGAANNSSECATALALQESFGPKYHVCVSHKLAWVYSKGGIYPYWSIDFPEAITEWIIQFDDGDQMQPISFQITESMVTHK